MVNMRHGNAEHLFNEEEIKKTLTLSPLYERLDKKDQEKIIGELYCRLNNCSSETE